MLVYQTCGFGRADKVGSSAAIASSPRLNASSRITRSPEKPRPEPDERAMNRSRFPFLSSIASLLGRRPDPRNPRLELPVVRDKRPDPQESLGSRLELVRAVQDQLGAEVVQEERR